MSYITPADFRAAGLTEYTQDLVAQPGGDALSTGEAPDAQVTAAITRLQARLDHWCNDHFEPEAGLTFELDGDGTRELYLPKRVRAITSVKTRDLNGTLTTQDPAVYRVRSSLTAAGDDLAREFIYDLVEVIPGKVLSNIATGTFYPYPPDDVSTRAFPWAWPTGPQAIEVTGDFSWAVTPPEIKRALALLVWDHFKARGMGLRRAEVYDTADARYQVAAGDPSGITEVDEIIAMYTKPEREDLTG